MTGADAVEHTGAGGLPRPRSRMCDWRTERRGLQPRPSRSHGPAAQLKPGSSTACPSRWPQ